MKTKEEYIEWVKNWKSTHESLVKLQFHVKRYLIKSKYPQEKYKLQDEEIQKCVNDFEEFFKNDSKKYFWISGNLIKWNREKTTSWYPDCIKGNLRSCLHTLHTMRLYEKEQFKNSELNTMQA